MLGCQCDRAGDPGVLGAEGVHPVVVGGERRNAALYGHLGDGTGRAQTGLHLFGEPVEHPVRLYTARMPQRQPGNGCEPVPRHQRAETVFVPGHSTPGVHGPPESQGVTVVLQ